MYEYNGFQHFMTDYSSGAAAITGLNDFPAFPSHRSFQSLLANVSNGRSCVCSLTPAEKDDENALMNFSIIVNQREGERKN